MSLRRLGTKPRGLLRDITLVIALILFVPDPRWMAIGAGVFVVGLALHIWSKGCLQRNWAVTTNGPYRFVRHPFYLASFLVDEGICIGSGNPWLCGLYVIAFAAVYWPTIRSEEAYLKGAFGDDYEKYAREVSALAPYRLHALLRLGSFSWHNIVREREMSRALRLLAIPAYFGVVAAVFHAPQWDSVRNMTLFSVSVATALALNAVSVATQRYERSRRLTA